MSIHLDIQEINLPLPSYMINNEHFLKCLSVLDTIVSCSPEHASGCGVSY